MIRIRDISLRPGESMAAVSLQAAKALRVKESAITQLYIYKKSIDARKKKDVRIVYTVDVAVKGNEKEWRKHSVFALRSAAKVRSFPSLKRFDFSMGGAYTFDTE